MASRRNDGTALAALPSAPDAPDNNSSLVEQLEDELNIQQAVLVSLVDFPGSTPQQIEAARGRIADIKREINQARGKGPSMSASMDSANGMVWSGNSRRTHATSAFSSASNSINSSPGDGLGASSRTQQRKRSFGSSHLDVDPWGVAKSRRPSPSPARAAFSSGSGPGFGFDDDFGDDGLQVIDLTGDDDSEWRSAIRRQKEAEDRAGRRKATEDRDAALARQLHGRPSPSTSPSPFAQSSRPTPNSNAFDRILGGPAWRSGAMGRVKQEPGPALVTRPHASPGTDQSINRHTAASPAVKDEPTARRHRMPGTYEDSDDEPEAFEPRNSQVAFGVPSRLPQPSFPSLGSPTPFSAYAATSNQTTLPSISQSLGFANDPFRQNTGLPPMEFARQASMARNGGSPSAWPPVGPIGHQLHRSGSGTPDSTLSLYGTSRTPQPGIQPLGGMRPGYMTNGAYYPQPGPSSLPGGLAGIINRTNRYDFDKMVDEHGRPLDARLTSYLDDYVNDPRKTEEDIKQLLSNIRPDMDIPEEERGETPEAMKYPLYVHQQVALKWMTDMEEGTNKGGILADDMGLGKTISTLALMVSRPSADSIKTNLIIGPVSLIKQWELEIKKKLKGTHKLSVFLLHQKKKSYADLKGYDVVLTTYGSLAAEWKRYQTHIEQRKDSPRYEEEQDPELARKCPLLHPKSKFYRVILDEAQYIKNKDTQGSKAVHKINTTYRWCLTGTPMMNGVSELYPLIRFLRIRPYHDFTTFQRAFRGLSPKSTASDYSRDNAMRQLQAVLKAMMLRRMKNSMIDGKPILTLPPKMETSEHVVFSPDERQFYQDLESRSQVLFNKFLRAGTVGKNYSNILVLLLRLRQACCHPHLTDFDVAGASVSENDMTELAKELDNSVVERIKAIEAFECPICYDGVEDPLLVIPCGHDTCTECFTSLTENAAQDNIRQGDENRAARCPVCRGPVDPQKVITLTAFRKVHVPEAVAAESSAAGALPELEDSDDSDDSDDSASDSEAGSDVDSNGNLADFVVPDGEVNEDEDDDDDDDKIDAELAAASQAVKSEGSGVKAEPSNGVKLSSKKRGKKASKKKRSKSNGKAAAKPKSEEIKPHMLKSLRLEAYKNKDAHRRYMHYLRDNWEDSAKVTEVIRLLETIQETDEKTIIFSQWTGLLDMIECRIKYALNLRFCRYTGKMSRHARDEAVRDFVENPRNKVMLVSLRAGNAGLNLTAASRIIICDPFWNPFIEMQAVDRAHRIGQQREVKVHRILVKETIEDRILMLQEGKRKLVDSALDEGQSRSLGRLSERELAYLFGVRSAGA